MKVSLEWISDFVDLPRDVDPGQVAHDLTLKTVEVENVIRVDGDVVFEVDNKSVTNRPDLWGHYGIARELAVIYGLELKPLPAGDRPEPLAGLSGTLDPALCQRFAAVEFTLEGLPATPQYIQDRLRRIGAGSDNLCLDLSNYVMFTVGQPTHVYDGDRLVPPLSVVVSDAPSTLELLSGQKVDLAEPTPVVRDTEAIVAVAGVMGGTGTAVHDASRRFVLEAATFRPGPVRRATQRLGLRTEASARFEKALDTQRVDQAIGLFLHLLREVVPNAVVSGMQDVTLESTPSAEVELSRDFLDRRIGEALETSELRSTLEGLGFRAEIVSTALRVTVPSWRSTGDVSLPHDILEEVARIHGYDRLSVAQTSVTLQPVRSLNRVSVVRAVREALAHRSGLQEVVTYPWAQDALVAGAGFTKEQTVRFEGMPAPDRGSLRPSLVPGLLETVATNLRHARQFGVFEIGTIFEGGGLHPYQGRYEALPPMRNMLGVALVGDEGVDLFRRAKGVVDLVRRHAHLVDLRCEGDGDAMWADRSARVGVMAGETRVGTLALLTPRVRRLAGIDEVQVACVELDLQGVRRHESRDNTFEPLPELPEADFDLSVVIADNVVWARIEDVVRGVEALVSAVSYVDEFRDSWVPQGHRSLTLRVTLRSKTATFSSESIGAARTGVLGALEREFGAHLR